MRQLPYLLLFSLSAYAASNPGLRKQFFESVQNPGRLDAFRAQCRAGGPSLDFDRDDTLFAQSNEAAAPTLLAAYAGCTDGASRLALRGFLGNEFLIAHPKALLEAAAAAKLNATAIREIVESEPVEFFAIECDTDACHRGRRKAFAQKRTALAQAPVGLAARATKALFLSQLRSDRVTR